MANVGSGSSGQTLIGAGNGASPTYAPIGTNSGLTANGVLIAEGNGAFSATAVGTSGQVLTSNGAGFDPTFQSASGGGIITIDGDSGSMTGSTVTISGGTTGLTTSASSSTMDLTGTLGVANGGTGDSSLTAYAVLTGGTSSTGAVQSVASVGTSGQVLTSNGAGALPSFQAASGGFSPNSTINVYDDFLYYDVGGITSVFISNIPWTSTGTWTVVTNSSLTSTNPGVVTHASITTHASLVGGVTGSYIILGGGAISCNWVLKAATLSNSTNRYTINAGLGVSNTGGGFNSIWFEYSDNVNSGNWVCNCTAAGSTTAINTSVAGSTSFVNLGFTVNAGATSVQFFINGSSQGSTTSNIPTGTSNADLTPGLSIVQSAGTIAAASVLVDLMYFTQTLTTAR